MSRHRAAPTDHRATARNSVLRPRYGRLAALGMSLCVTAIALLGGTGLLPSATGSQSAQSPPITADNEPDASAARAEPETATVAQTPAAVADPTPPPVVSADSGTGRRVVFDQSDQRVWLIAEDDTIARTYLVSGSLTENLLPGSYQVYSRSAHATGIDDSGTMRYFVRFTTGTNGAAIGFHDIPVNNGEQLQSVEELGTPLSHGCIRQARRDAVAMWGFAPIGSTVVVTA